MNELNFLDNFEQHFLRCHFKNFPSFEIAALCSTYIQWLWFLVAVVSSRYVSFIIFMTRSTIRPKNLRHLKMNRLRVNNFHFRELQPRRAEGGQAVTVGQLNSWQRRQSHCWCSHFWDLWRASRAERKGHGVFVDQGTSK